MANQVAMNKKLIRTQHQVFQNEEELTVPSQDLCTDESSDDEKYVREKENRLTKLQQKLAERGRSNLNYTVSKAWNSITKKTDLFFSSASKNSLYKEDSTKLQFNWKPKKGSLNWPGLFTEDVDSESQDENTEQDESNYFQKFNAIKLSIPKLENVSDAKNHSDKVIAMMDNIQKLEEKMIEQTRLLEGEKRKRLKIQKEICLEVGKADHYYDENDLCISKLCRRDDITKPENGGENHNSNVGERQKNRRVAECESNRKNFIHRNVELASTAMSKLPLTDEEKQHLDQILSDMDLADTQGEEQNHADVVGQNEETSEEINLSKRDLQNAFQLCDSDKQRISEIDSELNNFTETQNLKLSSNKDADNFWRNLILQQMLEEIDEKLAALRQDDNLLKTYAEIK